VSLNKQKMKTRALCSVTEWNSSEKFVLLNSMLHAFTCHSDVFSLRMVGFCFCGSKCHMDFYFYFGRKVCCGNMHVWYIMTDIRAGTFSLQSFWAPPILHGTQRRSLKLYSLSNVIENLLFHSCYLAVMSLWSWRFTAESFTPSSQMWNLDTQIE
jgi:hypothetical protein